MFLLMTFFGLSERDIKTMPITIFWDYVNGALDVNALKLIGDFPENIKRPEDEKKERLRREYEALKKAGLL